MTNPPNIPERTHIKETLICCHVSESGLSRRIPRDPARGILDGDATTEETVPLFRKLAATFLFAVAAAAAAQTTPAQKMAATILQQRPIVPSPPGGPAASMGYEEGVLRSEEHTSELQSLRHLVCRL